MKLTLQQQLESDIDVMSLQCLQCLECCPLHLVEHWWLPPSFSLSSWGTHCR